MHRTYSLLVVGLAFAMAFGFGLYGRSFEPLTGDLTRLGWYSENEFGWNRPQQRFAPPLAEPARPDGRYDIVAIGDSFTAESAHNPGVGWPHYLARDTGLAIGTLDIGVAPIDALLESAPWRDHPPAILVYEIVERSLVPQHRAEGGAGACGAGGATPRPALRIAPRADLPLAVPRQIRREWDDWPASYAINYLLQNAIRAIRGHETTSAVRLEMATIGLFSSRYERGLLVYAEDFNKIGWSEADWVSAICGLVRLQDRVQANGRTAFLAMVVPDKLTVYAPFLPYRSFDGLSHLDRLADRPELNIVRLDRTLDPRRIVDLYLPNDTHWSAAGHERAAGLVRDALLERGMLRR